MTDRAACKDLQPQIGNVQDAATIHRQQQIIDEQQRVIEQQRLVIQKVRHELIECKKQYLIDGASATPQAFRDSLKTYLLDLRTQLQQLSKQQQQHAQGSGTVTAAASNAAIDDEKQSAAQALTDESMTPAVKSALYLAAGRALESVRTGKERLFTDEYAPRFASLHNNAAMVFMELFAEQLTQLNLRQGQRADVTADYLAGFVALRTKWMDDSIYHAFRTDKQRMRDKLTKGTIKQLVFLGCGCDARSFRLSKLPKDGKVFYVDTPDMMRMRDGIFSTDLGICQCVNVTADLRRDEWLTALVKAGFDAKKKSVFVAEGVLEYMAAKDVQRLLSTVRDACVGGSWLIAECPNVVNVNTKEMHDIWCILGAQRMVTGFDVPRQEILERYGFTEHQEVNVLGTGESNYKQRCPEAYVEYQTQTKPMMDDPVARIQLFRGMKAESGVSFAMDNDGNDEKSQ